VLLERLPESVRGDDRMARGCRAPHSTYHRRDPDADGYSGVDGRGHSIDNRWVVPYIPYLTLKYGAHINIQVCSSTRALKQLFQYLFVLFPSSTSRGWLRG